MNSNKKSFFLPLIAVFIAVMVVVLSTFYVSMSSVQKERQTRAEEIMKETEQAVINRMQIQEEILRAATGLFSGSENVSKQEWANFIDSTNVIQRYPGTQATGYITVVDIDDVQNFVNKAKTDISPEFQIRPSGDRTKYAIATYIEPSSDLNLTALGYDIYSEQVRLKASMAATDTGQVIMTDAIMLVQEEDLAEKQYGFVLYAPQYDLAKPTATVEDRRNAIQGYVFASFRGEDLLNQVLLKHQQDSDFSYQIKKSTGFDEQISFYKTSQYEDILRSDSNKVVRSISINGSTWEFSYAYLSKGLINESASNRPVTILLYGTLLAVLITGIIFLLLRGKANQMALAKERETNEAKDNLLSIASHQLRTPATGVKQYLGMVLQGFAGDTSPKQSVLLEKAYESNERQLKTINEVLYLARLDSGRIVLSKQNIVVQNIINSLIDEQKDSIKNNRHKIIVKMPKNPVKVNADEHMLRMAIENLMTNAIKYTPQKGQINITLKQYKSDVFIEIKDNGVGIAREDTEQVFKAFSRVPNELSKTVFGTGIGLYLVRHLTLLHGGDVAVESEPGLGSIFTIRIPKN
jgi:signal transduction histidine kinase